MAFGLSAGSAALIGGGMSLLGASMGADASRGAANTQAASADRATALQKQMYDEGVARSQPFYQSSVDANNSLRKLMGLDGGNTMQELQSDPGYQFRLSEGMSGVQNSAAARGNLLSGGTLKALQKYGQDFASNEYTNRYNRLSSMAGGGQVANNMNSMGANFGSNAGNNMMSGANASAAGQVGAANAWNGGISNAINGWQQNQLMQTIGGNKQKPRYSSYEEFNQANGIF
jgi:hypothetical protein